MTTPPDLLARAVAIAADAHSGQRDKNGAPYILHPMRVMLRMDSDETRTVAALHDVVEDSDGRWTLARLRQEGFAPEVVTAVDAISRRPGESYATFVLRAAQDPLAKRVKLADLQDNMDQARLAAFAGDEQQAARLGRYRQALRYITGEIGEAEYVAQPE
jgi:(p)ppGpp synthase/HD superfamily hydrolase